jgi:hypothetical protein
MTCSSCDDYGVCSGIPCPDHFLKTGYVKEMCDMMDDGGFWGDMVYQEYQAFLAAETPCDRVIRMLKESAADKKQMENLRDYKTQKYVNRSTGKMMARLNLPCRYANSPESVDRHGVVWPAGCEPHRKGICPYLHPGEAGYEESRVQKKRMVRW